MASNIVTLKDATKTNDLLPRTRLKALCDDSGNYLDSALAASDINGLKNGGLAAKADKVTSPTTGDILKTDASGNPVDSGIAAANVAQQDGYYENMSVGSAGQIISTIQEEDKTPYNFRTSGGALDIGDRKNVEGIVGGTINWNQLCPNNVLTTKTVNGVTITNNGDGSYTLNGTASADIEEYLTGSMNLKGHTVLFGFVNVPSLITGLRMRDQYSYTITGIVSVATFSQCAFALVITNGTTLNNVKIIPIIHDLTVMFGSAIANYLATKSGPDIIAWLKSYGFFTKPYYAYDAGTLMSVCVSEHNTTGFNQWDEEWELGSLAWGNGTNSPSSSNIRSKNYIPVIPETSYYYQIPSSTTGRLEVFYYDRDKNLIRYETTSVAREVKQTPAGCCYVRFYANTNYGTTYKNDICINLHWDGERDGEYEAYVKHNYPLDSTKELRGIPKLDSNNKLYYDGDVYYPDGTVKTKMVHVTLNGSEDWSRNADGTPYFLLIVGAKGAVVDTNIIADKYTQTQINWSNSNIGINVFNSAGFNASVIAIRPSDYSTATLTSFKQNLSSSPVTVDYMLATPIEDETPATSYPELEIVDDFGTEEFVDYPESQGTRDVAVPVGHITNYQPNLRAKIEMAPDSPSADGLYLMKHENGENTYVQYVGPIPADPSEDGTYVLKCTVSSGTATLAWVAEE